jgi:hypothetical protein
MARPKGSKNKTTQQKVEDIIAEVKELPADATEINEAVAELEDLLDTKIEVTPDVVAQIKPEPKEKKFYGYHPITGAEVWL